MCDKQGDLRAAFMSAFLHALVLQHSRTSRRRCMLLELISFQNAISNIELLFFEGFRCIHSFISYAFVEKTSETYEENGFVAFIFSLLRYSKR